MSATFQDYDTGIPMNGSPAYQGIGANSPATSGYNWNQAPSTAYNTVTPASGTAVGSNPLQPNPGGIAATAPANIQQFGGTAQVSPTYAGVSTVDPNQNNAYLQQYSQLLNTNLQPQFQSQDQALQDSLAARGISSSGSGQYLQNQLYGQQASALAGGLEPLVSQGYGYTQQDITGNQAYQNQANLTNAAASNNASAMNAGYYNADVGANANAYNNYENELLGMGGGQLSALQAAYLNSFGANTGVTSAYNNALSGQLGTYGSVYGNAISGQGAALGGAGAGLGTYFGDAAIAAG